MKDRDFLIWLHERLTDVHQESPLNDYMHKLRAIIAGTPAEKVTSTTVVYHDIDVLKGE